MQGDGEGHKRGTGMGMESCFGWHWWTWALTMYGSAWVSRKGAHGEGGGPQGFSKDSGKGTEGERLQSVRVGQG